MSISLRPVVLMNQSAAGTSPAVALDYRFGAGQQRNIGVQKNTADTVVLEVSVDGTNFQNITTFGAGVTNTVYTLLGPWLSMRVTKVGAAGNALVQGVV